MLRQRMTNSTRFISKKDKTNQKYMESIMSRKKSQIFTAEQKSSDFLSINKRPNRGIANITIIIIFAAISSPFYLLFFIILFSFLICQEFLFNKS